ncbi:MAG TPA: hypothetical protein VGM92_12960 [Candidatus Kapabacteria bacterium]|jgi:hypothetical protein
MNQEYNQDRDNREARRLERQNDQNSAGSASEVEETYLSNIEREELKIRRQNVVIRLAMLRANLVSIEKEMLFR